MLDLNRIELELNKRIVYPYIWGKKQNNEDDRLTNFIYDIDTFEDLIVEIDKRFKDKSNYKSILNYTLNRWYNYWSAKAVEFIFCSLPGVVAAKDARDRLIDFSIEGINFDHKTSVFPRKYPDSFEFAKKNPKDLCEWLYKNQSQENRKHLKNRIFIVLFSSDGEHWKLKSNIFLLKQKIELYIKDFDKNKLLTIQHKDGNTALSDIIWFEQ
ncbi:MAG: hypothetical protein JW866_03580 [Ignavibacteriales bacterium]|nr:hypothetical protein [Ignavibacteriales bacterium]